MLPEPGSQDWDKMAEFMRADLVSNMTLSKIIGMTRKQYKEQGRDFDEEFQKWKAERSPGIIKVKCAWCGLDMGTKECDKNDKSNGKTSHSICDECLDKIEKKGE